MADCNLVSCLTCFLFGYKYILLTKKVACTKPIECIITKKIYFYFSNPLKIAWHVTYYKFTCMQSKNNLGTPQLMGFAHHLSCENLISVHTEFYWYATSDKLFLTWPKTGTWIIFGLYSMHMGLKSLESTRNCTSFDSRINSFEYIKPIHCSGILWQINRGACMPCNLHLIRFMMVKVNVNRLVELKLC